MTRHVQLVIYLAAMLCSEAAFSQSSPREVTGSGEAVVSTVPVADVYVSSNVYASNPRIYAYGAASNGKLTAVPGSPFTAAIAYGGSLAVNAKYLFATNGSISLHSGLRPMACFIMLPRATRKDLINPIVVGR